MFLSFFKKKETSTDENATSSSPAPPTPPVTTTPISVENSIEPEKETEVNLPGWKDKAIWLEPDLVLEPNVQRECRELQDTITDILGNIRDPEKPNTLEELDVINESSVQVQPLSDGQGYMVRIDFNPTVPHCSLASVIGLCLRTKINKNIMDRVKLDIVITEGKHSTEEEINKQINDKERVAAALENPNLKGIVENCIKDQE